MNVIEHWIADNPTDPGVPVVIPDAQTAERYRTGGWIVYGPFVLAEQLQEAVDRDALDRVGGGGSQ